MADERITPLLMPWFKDHGRRDLPWQLQRDSCGYRVWLSEIMLQQTQVNTVIPYFNRFVAAFPDFSSLAAAPLDRVLQLWAGLGYYARARNLHRCAQIVVAEHDGCLPAEIDQLEALPGIGRSTAGAIRSLAFGRFAAILDGNVKRVLSRVYRVQGWAGQSAVARQLWQLAERETPQQQTADYNQAMMDLGATVCSRSRPRCSECPLPPLCQSYQYGEQALYPQPKPRKARPQRHTWMLLHRSGDQLLLERRPAQGIWGGLWSLPEIGDMTQLNDWQCRQFGLVEDDRELQQNLLRHQFSHFELSISLAVIHVSEQARANSCSGVNDEQALRWVKADEISEFGLPAPVARLLAMPNTG